MSGIRPEDLLARLVSGIGEESRIVRRSKSEPEPTAHWTSPILLERCAYLRKMARAGEGFATDTLRESAGYSATLVTRLRNSPAEALESVAQFIFVLEGRATLITGGLIENPRKIAPGHTTGSSIAGGTAQDLRTGDVVHIAAGVPVQFQVPNEKAFSCLVLRITEIEG